MRFPVASLAFVAILASGFSSAQPLVEFTEELDFDRPESWAMKYFASLALMTGMGVPERMGPGAIDVGFEGGFVPQLDDDQRRVGFGGTKLEELNRTHFFGRVRGRIGLSETISLELGYVPPFDLGGTKPNLFAIGVGRPFRLSETWQLGLRGYGQFGTIEGDITCSEKEIETGPNPFNCEAPSNDQITQRVYGVEVNTGFVSDGPWRPYFGIAFNYMDLEFQIDALYSGIHDRTLQLTDGGTVSFTGGITYVANEKWRIMGELFYSPLSVVRPPSTSSQNDGLFNGRFLITYRIR